MKSERTSADRSNKASLFLVTSLALLTIAPSEIAASELTRREVVFWDDVYQIVNPGQKPVWPKGGPHAWARTNAEALDTIIAEIIRGNNEMPWTHGLLGARVTAGEKTRDALFDRLSKGFDNAVAGAGEITEADCAKLTGILRILVANGDQRPVPVVNTLLRDGKCDNKTKEQLLAAVRQIGNEDSQRTLAELRKRESDKRVDRSASLSEKVIAARIRGEKVSPDAQVELRDLCTRFLVAMNERNRDLFIASFPYGMKNGLDERDFEDLLHNEEAVAARNALERVLAAGSLFEVNEEDLTAVLKVGEFQFDFIYEVDGWKIVNTRRAAADEPAERR